MDVLDPAFPSMVRAARSLLGWSQMELAYRAGVSNPFVSRFERLETVGRPANLQKLAEALCTAGVTFDTAEDGFGIYLRGRTAYALRQENRRAQLKIAARMRHETDP